MMSPGPCGICLHSLILVSQSAFSIQLGHAPTECINHGTCHVPFILTLTIRQTTMTVPNRSFHQHHSVHLPAASPCTHKVQALSSTACSINTTALSVSTSISKVSSFICQAGCPAHSAPLVPKVNSLFQFQMVALNFERILLMLKDMGSIPRETLHSQDGLNLGDIHFCPLRQMLRMQHLSLDGLRTLLAKGTFMPPQLEGHPELSGTTTIILVFQADSWQRKLPMSMWDSWPAKLSSAYTPLTRSSILSRT